jgi:hypothetical protein
MLNLYKFLDVLQLNAPGHIKRDVGELFLIGVDNPTQALYKRYTGTWLISRIYHIISKGNYRQDISLVRTDQMMVLYQKK